MKRVFVPTHSANDWKALLAKPDLHWKPGHSAMSLATCWESAHPRMPTEVENACRPLLGDLTLLAAFPEWEVSLPGGTTASQTDLLVLARSSRGLVVIAVEGKVEEPFGPTLGEKRQGASAGQNERLEYLHTVLGLKQPAPDHLRHQLFHRIASALLAAQDFAAPTAVMLVHSFSSHAAWLDDFSNFAAHLGAAGAKDALAPVDGHTKPQLYLGWVTGDRHFTTVDQRENS